MAEENNNVDPSTSEENNVTDPQKEDKKKKKTVNVFSLKKDMDEFKKETKETNKKILGALESIMNKDDKVAPLEEEEEAKESEVVKLTQQQRDIFEYYFAPEDGFTAWYDINLNIFTIEVPLKLSNTTEAHRALYKKDLRSKKVDPNNILGSIKAWCILVTQNLKYEKRIKLK